MYQYLKGTIIEKINAEAGSEKLILDVNGIGFEINTTLQTLELIGKKGEVATVYTTLIHKEDGMTLIGFLTLMERELFNLLTSVTGIGSKTGLNLLNNLTVSEISYSILNEEISNLCKAQGIGERTAGRIILELKEKIKNWQYLPIAYSEVRAESSGLRNTNQKSHLSLLTSHLLFNEARDVLQSLGYSSFEISQAFNQAKNNDEIKNSEELVNFSLRWLVKTKK